MRNENQAALVSRMSRWETAAALCWIPVHILGLPLLLAYLRPGISAADLNFWVYVIGVVYLGSFCLRFLRRDFDPLWDNFGRILILILVFYGYMILGNLLVSGLLSLILPAENPNSEAVVDLAAVAEGKITVMTVILAPILEELMFRAGLFGLLRRYNRLLAYGTVILVFGAYHVWAYALADPRYWLFMLQYVPVTFLLCLLYEKTGTIWSSILLHILVNAVSLWALSLLRGLGL